MSRWTLALLLAIVVGVGGWLGYATSRPPDFHSYRVTAVEAARDGLLIAGLTADAFPRRAADQPVRVHCAR